MKFIAICVLSSSAIVSADDEYRPWGIQGVGENSCERYLHHKNDGAYQEMFKQWFAGYLTAQNLSFRMDSDPSRVDGVIPMILSLTDFCTAHPKNSVKAAIDNYLQNALTTGIARKKK